MTGKSQAVTIIAKVRCELDPSIRIGVHCKSMYKRLVAQGIPEENLVMMWEEPEPWLEIIWGEA